MRSALLLACALLAGQVGAQEGFDPSATETCLAKAASVAEAEACAGAAAEMCMTTMPGGTSTVGMSNCLHYEAQYWEQRLETAYQAVLAGARVWDAQRDDMGAHVPSRVAPLEEMHVAFAALRQARCAYERALWGGGSGGGPAWVSCELKMTARQALYLEAAQTLN